MSELHDDVVKRVQSQYSKWVLDSIQLYKIIDTPSKEIMIGIISIALEGAVRMLLQAGYSKDHARQCVELICDEEKEEKHEIR